MKQKIVRAACNVRIADRLQLDRNSKKKASSKVNLPSIYMHVVWFEIILTYLYNNVLDTDKLLLDLILTLLPKWRRKK